MSNKNQIDPGHKSTRKVFRIAGPIILGIGILCMITAAVDLFMCMGNFGRTPTLFWLFFVGAPLLFVGAVLSQMGYMGKIARYTSQELTPVGTDTFNYAVKETKDSIREVAGAIGEGLGGAVGAAGSAEVMIRCYKCNHENDADARFCDQCGAALTKNKSCPACNELNDLDAKFCDNCGNELAND